MTFTETVNYLNKFLPPPCLQSPPRKIKNLGPPLQGVGGNQTLKPNKIKFFY